MQCQHCGSQVSDLVPVARYCPYCGQALDRARQSVDWKAIARFSDLAEVGFVADALEGAGIPARVEQRSDLVTDDAAWRSLFVLHVRASDTVRAVEHLRVHQQAENDDGEPPPPAFYGPLTRAIMASSLALLLVSGGLGYVVGQTTRPAPKTTLQAEAFWNALRNSPPLYSQRRPDAHPRRLRFIPQANRFALEEDLNSDGSYDRRYELAPMP